MSWSWVQPAVWIGLGLLAAEIGALFTLAWRAPHRLAVQRIGVQVRKAIEDVADDAEERAATAAKEADGRTAEIMAALDDIRELLQSIDDRGEKAMQQ